uniref:Uncharacterized protein n=1 Tax=Ditylenchus dipsaci TaxID=166011 RepID=A0A915DDJ8_9BILA
MSRRLYDSGIVFDYHLSGSNTQLTLGHNCALHLEEQIRPDKSDVEEHTEQRKVFANKEADMCKHATLPSTLHPTTPSTVCTPPLRRASQMSSGQLASGLISNGFSRHQHEGQSVI